MDAAELSVLPRAAGEGGTTEPTTTAVSWVDWYRASIPFACSATSAASKVESRAVPPPSEGDVGRAGRDAGMGARQVSGMRLRCAQRWGWGAVPCRVRLPSSAAGAHRVRQLPQTSGGPCRTKPRRWWYGCGAGALGALPETEAGLIRGVRRAGGGAV